MKRLISSSNVYGGSDLDQFIGKDLWVFCQAEGTRDMWCRFLDQFSNGEYKVNVVYEDEMGYFKGDKYIPDICKVTPSEFYEYSSEWTTFSDIIPYYPIRTKPTDGLFLIVE